MKSPKDMNIIQIDITNACIHECSNCTRFCGHHKKPYFMDLDMVKKAIDSLDDFDGIIGIMGGEPTLHPQFEEITLYLAAKYTPEKRMDTQLFHPQTDFLHTIEDLKALHHKMHVKDGVEMWRTHAPGLWSAMGDKFV
ncbi:MAG: radical SAM protein, partial [Bacillota bacterium]